MPKEKLTQREIRAAIRLTGIGGDYQVHHDIAGEAIVCHVSQAAIGHLIVRTLRERQRPALGRVPAMLEDLNADVSDALDHLYAGRTRDAVTVLKGMADWIRERLPTGE